MPEERLVVGLGNPGVRYAKTRHNIGFMALERLAAKHRVSLTSRRNSSIYAMVKSANANLILVKPMTYMNLSGQAVRAWVNYYRIPYSNILIIYDDISLSLGRLRFREAGSAGGHNGMKSLISALGSEDIPRLRIGVGPKPDVMDARDFVLAAFKRSEEAILEHLLSDMPDIVMCWSHEGLTEAANRYNGVIYQ